MEAAAGRQDLRAQLRSSPAAALHGFGGPFASSPEEQSLHVPPLRATPDSPQSSHSSKGWPALGLCLDPCMPLAPARKEKTVLVHDTCSNICTDLDIGKARHINGDDDNNKKLQACNPRDAVKGIQVSDKHSFQLSMTVKRPNLILFLSSVHATWCMYMVYVQGIV